MKQAKRILSLVLTLAMLLSVMPVMPVQAEESSDTGSSSKVAVGVANASGTMDLTSVGSTDWMHITHSTINRKAVPTDPIPEGVEVIDFLSTAGTSGRTFGQTSDQVWRFQTFAPTVSGPLTSVKVALIKKGTPSTLIAKLYKVTDTSAMTVEEIASTTVAAEDISDNTALALNFGTVTVEAGTYYAVALTQETTDPDNLYHWCKASTSFPSGKVKEDGTWAIENTAASLQVIIGEYTIPEQEAVGILNFELVGAATMTSSMSDSPLAYTWSDGMPTSSKSGYTSGGVVAYINGTQNETITEEAGWKITVPADNSIQTLSFTTGVWNASGEIYITADGENVYSNTELTAGGTSVVKTYTVTVSPNVAVEVNFKLTGEGHAYGNSSIGGITLSRTAVAGPSVTVDVSTGSGNMNLTEVGTTDWMHITHNQIDRKVVPTGEEVNYEVIDRMNASASRGRTIGRTTDEVKRYQTFTPTISGPLTSLEVAVIKKGSPSALIATLVKMETKEEVATVTIPADSITSNTAFDLGFTNVNLEADVTYALVMTQETLTEESSKDLYWWCNTTASEAAGKIKETGVWVEESGQQASIRVTIGEPGEVNDDTVDLINFELVGAATMTSSMSDSAVVYSWSDGYPTVSSNNNRTGGVISYQSGSYTGEVTEEAGWKLTIPASDSIQTLTFVSGVWQASCEIYIYVNGSDEPIYSNTELTAGGTSTLLQYTVTVSPDTSIEVYSKLTNKGHTKGNVSIGGIALSEKELDASQNYIELLKEAVKTAEAWLNEEIDEYFINQLTNALTSAKAALEKEDLTQSEAYSEYVFLKAAIDAVESAQASGSFANSYASGNVCSFGWEGDKHAPITWVDGTYRLRDNGDKYITFGVPKLPAESVEWYNAEGYLPCFVSEYSKNGLTHKIENFADLVVINGKEYEIAYSRMTTTNTTDETKLLPKVSTDLVALNDAAATVGTVEAGETVVREYCIGADRFGNSYAWPTSEELVAAGTWDAHYTHMKDYWNTRLEGIVEIQNLPEDYEVLINAYKAGYIYTLIIADGYELHVGENGYDRVFDHDVIGMLATLIESGHTEHFADYAQYILLNIQYPDAAWKFSWPFALYLQKTGDYDTILRYFEDQGSTAGIKTNTHKIGAERIVYDASILDEDGNPARIMKKTNAIDSNGYWVIDNWAALFGLTTYSYLCNELYEHAETETDKAYYKAEYDWARAEYDSLLKSVEAFLANTMETYDFNYIPISMVVPNELSARKNVRDGNWAAMYLFGRWNWDGYLFGADQDSWLLDLTDTTYSYIIEQKSTALPSMYTMGGYPGYSSAYNAGYYSAALSGEKYRDGGIEAYIWMIQNAQSSPFGWWEGISNPNTSSPWVQQSCFGSGSSQHMWGQSVATKVLVDSFFAEKYDGSIIAGRGLPLEFNADGEQITISNYICNGGKRIGFDMVTNGTTITFTLTGDQLSNTVSLELLALKNNIKSVSDDVTYDNAAGTVTIPAGVTSVTIEMVSGVEALIEREAYEQEAKAALAAAEAVNTELYVTSTVEAMEAAVAALEEAVANGTNEQIAAACEAVYAAIDALVLLKTYDVVFDTYTGASSLSTPSFGEDSDERIRYTTFKTGDEAITFDQIMVHISGGEGDLDDILVSIYTLGDDHYTLADCVATARLDVDSVTYGENIGSFESAVTLAANTYYAIHFDMDHSNGLYGSWMFSTTTLLSEDLYSVKIQGSGNVVNESFLGTAMMQLFSDKTDKTALDAAVESASENVSETVLKNAVEVLLNKEATQEEIDAALAALTSEIDVSNVIALINAIGEVTVDSGSAIEAARAAYDALTDEEKTYVTNYQTLLDAEHDYVILVAQSYADEAKKAAEEAKKAYEDAKKAAEDAMKQTAEDKEAAEKAAEKAEAAQKAAEEAQAKAEEAQKAAEDAAAAAEASNKAAAAEAVKAAEEAAKAATEAAAAAESAKLAAEAQEKAQAAQAAAEAAQKAAEEAQAKAEEAQKKAEEAANSAAEDKEAAEQAAAEAKAAQEAAEAAQKAAEDAKSAAETAAAAADASNKAAAESAALAAQYAQEVAEMYLEIVAMKAEMTDMLSKAQAAQEAAEKAALASAKYYALFTVADIAANTDTSGYTDHQVKDYEAAVKAAQDAIDAAAAIEEVEAAVAALEAAIAAIEDSCPAKAFADVELDRWYHEGIDFMVTNGYMNGMSATEFAPNAELTRAQIVTILYRVAGEPSVAGLTNPFTDVEEGKFYTNAVIWAYNKGIVMGVDDTTFAPNSPVTREQMVTFLYRFAGTPDSDKTALEGYEDVSSVAKFAVDAVAWAVENGILTGTTATTLAPKGTATRAQIAAILARYLAG